MTTVLRVLSVGAGFFAPIRGVFSSACSFLHHPFTHFGKEVHPMRTAHTLLTVAAAMICAALLVAFATSPACAQGGGKALDFDGTDDYVTISSVLSTSTTEATFEAWIYPELFTEFQDVIYHGDNGEMTLNVSDNSLATNLKLGDETWYGTAKEVALTSQWYHLVGVWKKGVSIKLYVNGIFENSAAVPDEFLWDPGSSFGSNIGSYDEGTSDLYQGKIDEVRIWNVARTQTQIQADMYQTLNGNESGLVGYWKLDESSGTSANDETSNDNDGTLNNFSGTYWVTSYVPLTSNTYVGGKCLDFDGSNEYVNTALSINGYNDVTIEAWFNAGSFAGEAVVSCYKEADKGLAISMNASSIGFGGRVYGGSYLSASYSTTMQTDTWYHAAGVKKDNYLYLYVNGVKKGEYDLGSDQAIQAPSYTRIGGDPNSTDWYLEGNIDEVRVWNTARTQEQIQTYMHTELVGDESNLVGYWRFDEGTGTSVEDLSPNSNNGTLTNMEEADWVDSDLSFDLASVWPTNTSNSSSIMTIDDSNISGDNAIILKHNRASLSANTSDVPGTVNRRLNRVWRLEEYGTLSGDVIFGCTGLGIGDGSALRVLVDADGTFSDAAIVSGSYSAPNFTVSGHSFEHTYYYTLASTSAENSLPIALSSFTAEVGDGEVTLHWVTESEVANLGFHVYRALEEEAIYERLTSEVIEGAGTSTGRREYAFTDVRLTNGVTCWYKIEDVAFDGTRTMHGPISVTPQAEEAVEVKVLPTEFGLSQNFPNPFNPVTEIRYQLPEASHVELAIYDVLGQEVQVLVDGFIEAGYRSVVWDAKDVGSGIYFVRMDAGDFVEVRKMVVMR